MVSVERVFQQVEELSRKERSAFAGSESFNRQQSLVQSTLFDYYTARYGLNRSVPEALLPFLKVEVIPAVAQYVAFPADFRSTLDIGARVVTSVPGGEPNVQVFPAMPLLANEENATVMSAVRKPGVKCKKFYWAPRQGGFKIYPKEITSVEVKYLAVPADAFRNYTTNPVTDVEDPNPTGTIDFLWQPDEEANLVDLFLIYRGIQTRNTDLLQWVAAKKQIVA